MGLREVVNIWQNNITSATVILDMRINNYILSTLDEIITNNQKFVEENPLDWQSIYDAYT